MAALGTVLAHQGGWDEILFVLAPLVVFAGPLTAAEDGGQPVAWSKLALGARSAALGQAVSSLEGDTGAALNVQDRILAPVRTVRTRDGHPQLEHAAVGLVARFAYLQPAAFDAVLLRPGALHPFEPAWRRHECRR